jgi:sn-glycerol 3-phosphate transport system ATP-binding protein
VVYVTHDQAEAMSMADQVVLLNKGRIEQNATPRALYAAPATFAARFIGTPPMNLAALDGRRGRRQRRAAERARPPAGPAARSGVARVAGGLAVPARVQSLEYLGADAGAALRRRQRELTVRAGRPPRPAVGARVAALARRGQHYFDADGRRIDP